MWLGIHIALYRCSCIDFVRATVFNSSRCQRYMQSLLKTERIRSRSPSRNRRVSQIKFGSAPHDHFQEVSCRSLVQTSHWCGMNKLLTVDVPDGPLECGRAVWRSPLDWLLGRAPLRFTRTLACGTSLKRH